MQYGSVGIGIRIQGLHQRQILLNNGKRFGYTRVGKGACIRKYTGRPRKAEAPGLWAAAVSAASSAVLP